MKKLHLISASPDDNYLVAQYWTLLYNFREMGYSDKTRVLFFKKLSHENREWNPRAKELEQAFPEVKFFWYEDDHKIENLIKAFGYVGLLRPYVLKRHWEEYPELENDAVFYHDSDIAFVRPLDFSPFLQDDIHYLSDTTAYNSASYFDSKEKDVLPHRLQEYKKRDILQETAKLVGIDRAICEANENKTGGAQYLLKNITAAFWEKVLNDCMLIRLHLRSVNAKFFPSEDIGFQSFCADMWAVLWNLWKRGDQTACPKELDFAWPTDAIEKWNQVYIYHDAGGGPDSTYRKQGPNNTYANNLSWPFTEDFSYVNPNKCSANYCALIQQTKQQFNLSNP